MAGLNDRYQYKDPFTLCEEATSEKAWRIADPEDAERLKDYTLLCSFVFELEYQGEHTVSWLDGTFSLFDDLVQGDKPYCTLANIADADGEVRKPRTGVFYYNKTPPWIVDQMMMITEIYQTIFSDNFVVVPILNEEHFKTWLGDNPNRMDVYSDFVMVPLANNVLVKAANPKYVKYFKTTEKDILHIIPFQFAYIDSERVVLAPAGSLAKWFDIGFNMPMDFFKKAVLASNTNADTLALTLLSVTTGDHAVEDVKEETKK